MNRSIPVLPLLILLVWLLPGSADAGFQVLPASTTWQRADAPVQVLVELPGQTLSRDDVLDPARAERWQTLPNGSLNLPLVTQPLWIRQSIRNDSKRSDWILANEWPLLRDTRLFLRKPGQDWQALKPALPSRAEPGAYYLLDLPPGESADWLLRVEPIGTAIIPIEFRTMASLDAKRQTHTALMGMLFGILLVMLAYNGCLAWFSGDYRYKDYTAYLASVVLYELAATGYGPILVWGDSPWLIQNGYALFGCMSFLAATWFFRRFLDLATCPIRHLRWFNNVFLAFWPVAAVLVLAAPGPEAYGSVVFASLLSGAAAIYTSVRLARAGNSAAWMFGVAWAALVGGTTVAMLALAGLLPAQGLAAYGQHLGFVIETVVLAMALAQRLQQARRQGQALRSSLEAEREERLRAQGRALSLQRQTNEELEKRVAKRTEELEHAMQCLESANAELAELSVTDALTRVHNRRYLDQALAREVVRPVEGVVPIALLMIDIDFFKRINDLHGHIVGDECLRIVAERLRNTVSQSADLVARYGGEEFAVVLPGADAAQAVVIAERLRLAIKASPVVQGDARIDLTVSIGVAALADHDDVGTWLSRADKALYLAKEAGRDRVVSADASPTHPTNAPASRAPHAQACHPASVESQPAGASVAPPILQPAATPAPSTG